MENDEITIDLLKIVKALWKKAWAIILVATIFGGAMFVYKKSSYVPVYQAKTILFANYTNNSDFSQSSASQSQNMVNTAQQGTEGHAVQNSFVHFAITASISSMVLGMAAERFSQPVSVTRQLSSSRKPMPHSSW